VRVGAHRLEFISEIVIPPENARNSAPYGDANKKDEDTNQGDFD
jgi:hypothetical protein